MPDGSVLLDSHRLELLWADFATMLERFGTEDPDEADPVVAEVIGQFAKSIPAPTRTATRSIGRASRFLSR